MNLRRCTNFMSTCLNTCLAQCLHRFLIMNTALQQEEGSSRGLLRDCEIFANLRLDLYSLLL